MKPLTPDALAYYRERVAELLEREDDLDGVLDGVQDGIKRVRTLTAVAVITPRSELIGDPHTIATVFEAP